MEQVITEAVKQTLKWFQSPGGAKDLAEGAEKVMKVAADVAKKGK